MSTEQKSYKVKVFPFARGKVKEYEVTEEQYKDLKKYKFYVEELFRINQKYDIYPSRDPDIDIEDDVPHEFPNPNGQKWFPSLPLGFVGSGSIDGEFIQFVRLVQLD